MTFILFYLSREISCKCTKDSVDKCTGIITIIHLCNADSFRDRNTGGHILYIEDFKDRKLQNGSCQSGNAAYIPADGILLNCSIQFSTAICNSGYYLINVRYLSLAGTVSINLILISKLFAIKIYPV